MTDTKNILSSQNTTSIGNYGEEIATDFLRENGYEIIDRNWRHGHLEVDIIARKGEMLHFVEVKTRGAGSWITPEEAFDATKNRNMLRAVNGYIGRYNIDCEVQVDLVAITTEENGDVQINLYPDVVNIHW